MGEEVGKNREKQKEWKLKSGFIMGEKNVYFQKKGKMLRKKNSCNLK